MMMTTNMQATRAEYNLHMFVPARTQGVYNHQYDGEWKLTTITPMMLVLVVVLVLAVRGAAAIVRCVQSCFGRRKEGVDTGYTAMPAGAFAVGYAYGAYAAAEAAASGMWMQHARLRRATSRVRRRDHRLPVRGRRRCRNRS